MTMKVPPLAPGATVGLVCPGSPPRGSQMEPGLAWLASAGFRVKRGLSAVAADGLHAGTPESRARDLENLFRDPEVDGILCVRGGSGTLGILPLLDYGLLAAYPKALIGMSDVTALQLACLRLFGRISLSAPMLVQLSGETPVYTLDRWLSLVRGPLVPGSLPIPEGATLRVLRAGQAEGPLLPCNLSLLVRLIGTPYLPSLEGALLVLEEIRETPQSLDRMLSHLRLSGVADGLAGLVLGQFTSCLPREDGVSETDGHDLVEGWARSLGVPVLAGFPYGHEPFCCALPLGTSALLVTDPPGLELREAPWSRTV